MYNAMQTQLETTRIHMAVSDRPMYTSWFGSELSGSGRVLTTFLSNNVREARKKHKDVPIGEKHADVHAAHEEDDVEPRVLHGD